VAADTPNKLLQSPYSVLQDFKAISEVALEAVVVVSVVASAVIEAALVDVVVSVTKTEAVLVVDKEVTKADHRLLTRQAAPAAEVGLAVVTKIEETVAMGEVGTIVEEQEVTETRLLVEIVGTRIETVIETGTEIETAIATATGTGMVEVETDETKTMVLASDITRATGMTTRESDGIDILPSHYCITRQQLHHGLRGGFGWWVFYGDCISIILLGAYDLPLLFRYHGKDFLIFQPVQLGVYVQ
jgi:hypothetical protein